MTAYAEAAKRNLDEAEELACRAMDLKLAALAILDRATWVASGVAPEPPKQPLEWCEEDISF